MAELYEYKCPCCGGSISFDSTVQKLKCPYCDTEFEAETLKDLDNELRESEAEPEDMRWDAPQGSAWQKGEEEGLFVYVCSSCGGQILADATTGATVCPYCDSPVVMKEQFSGALRPDLVIPFKLDKDEAKAGLLRHLKGKILLPKVFKDENHIDEIKGIYVPFWLFDTDAKAGIRYRATRVRTFSDSNYIYTSTSHYSVFRRGSLSFKGVPADASQKMNDDLMDSVEPFDYSHAVDFQTAYLAGYLADKYDISAEESAPRANLRIKKSTEELFAQTVKGYASVIPEQTHIKLEGGKTRYALLPLWILNTTWHGKKYTFAMNGQTGKFVGNLPMDNKKFAAYFAGITAGVGAAAFLLLTLLQSF